MVLTPEIQRMGIEACKRKMTQEQKKDRARNASIIRWKKKKGVDWHPPIPEAAYQGVGFLGDNEIECYVLTNGDRVISYSQAVRLISGKSSGDLKTYIEMLPKTTGGGKVVKKEVKSLITKDEVAAETLDFYIPGNPSIAKGIKAETFAEICRSYVEAAYRGLLATPRQREIAMKCAFLQSGFMKLGILSFVDEITGYEKKRGEGALQLKIAAFIQDEARKWEKTFPDMFYQELARLTGIDDWRKKPSFYGKITNKIYKMVDPDVAAKIKEMSDLLGDCRHQHLTENLGLPKLRDSINQAIGLARSCLTIQEFNQKMKLFEPGGAYQMSFHFDNKFIKDSYVG